jgi:hypothetical protein
VVAGQDGDIIIVGENERTRTLLGSAGNIVMFEKITHQKRRPPRSWDPLHPLDCRETSREGSEDILRAVTMHEELDV